MDLLQIASNEIIVPRIVAQEIQRKGSADPTVQALEHTSWLRVTDTPPVPPIIQAWGLGQGESAVLSWAWANQGAEAIIDDLSGRRCADALGIPVRGTLGLVLAAKRRGKIASARATIDRLLDNGMYLSEEVLKKALALVEE